MVVTALTMTCLPLGAAGSAGAAAGTGGAFAGDPAVISAVGCVARCASVDGVQAGSLLRLRGTGMKDVTRIVFLGAADPPTTSPGPSPRPREERRRARAREGVSGPLRADQRRRRPSLGQPRAVSVRAAAPAARRSRSRSSARRVFYGGRAPGPVNLLARAPMAVTVALVRLSDGAAVRAGRSAWSRPAPCSSIIWDGTVGGAAQPAGRYEFRVFSQSRRGAGGADG